MFSDYFLKKKSGHFQLHRRHAHLFCLLSPAQLFIITMHMYALKNNRSPGTAVLPPPVPWQSWWLTAGLTIPFSHHLLAVNQVCHPGAIDRAVSLCETCLSKPLSTVVDWVTFFSYPIVPCFLYPCSYLHYEVIDSFSLMLPLYLVHLVFWHGIYIHCHLKFQ